MRTQEYTLDFPSISEDEFERACIEVVASYNAHTDQQHEWASASLVKAPHHTILRIKRELKDIQLREEFTKKGEEKLVEDTPDVDEDDEETLLVERHAQWPVLEYDILLSQSYRVPVLYFSLRDNASGSPLKLENLSRSIIPDIYRNHMDNIGVVGGVSMTDHPSTGAPSYFIHPCLTPDAMKEVSVDGKVKVGEYLYVWLGIVGPCVGLYAPLFMHHRFIDTNSTV